MGSEIILSALVIYLMNPHFIDKANVSEVACWRSTAARGRATIWQLQFVEQFPLGQLKHETGIIFV